MSILYLPPLPENLKAEKEQAEAKKKEYSEEARRIGKLYDEKERELQKQRKEAIEPIDSGYWREKRRAEKAQEAIWGYKRSNAFWLSVIVENTGIQPKEPFSYGSKQADSPTHYYAAKGENLELYKLQATGKWRKTNSDMTTNINLDADSIYVWLKNFHKHDTQTT